MKEQVAEKVAMVRSADAVVGPGAMMIKPENTLVTLPAVLRSHVLPILRSKMDRSGTEREIACAAGPIRTLHVSQMAKELCVGF